VILRFLHLLIAFSLVAAAAAVYEVKYESTYDAQRSMKLRAEISTERERIAILRAEWSRLASPARIQDLAIRYLGMQPLAVTQIDDLAKLPGRPKPPGDPIRDIIETLQADPKLEATGSINRDR
jgi:hypothetical protein